MGGTTYLHHNWHLTQLPNKFLRLSIVDSELKGGGELSAICDMSLSALGGEDFTALGELIGGWYLGFLKGDALVPDGQLVLGFWGGPVVAIQVGLCPDLGERMVEQTGLPIGAEEGVEGFDVWVDGLLESWVRCTIGGWVPEELFTADRVKLVVPGGVCFCRRHLHRLAMRWERQCRMEAQLVSWGHREKDTRWARALSNICYLVIIT